ncbi:MAG: VOC family protein [Pseudomonadota bacterium]
MAEGEREFLFAQPHIFSTDIERTLRFFTDVLGFAVDFTYGEPPTYAEVFRDAARVSLRLVAESPFKEGVRDRDELLSALIRVRDIDAFAASLRDVPLHLPLTERPWGRELIVKDPDGNLLCFHND